MKLLRLWPALFLVCIAASDVPRQVTVQQLLANPKKFNGRRVDVIGYFYVATEEVALFANAKAAARTHETDTSIWLDTDKWYASHSPRDVSPFDRAANHTARVVGTFHYRKMVIIERDGGIDAKSIFGYGGGGGWYEREIDSITYIRRTE